MASMAMLLCLLSMGICIHAQPWIGNTDVQALLSFQSSLGEIISRRTNWSTSEDPCSWSDIVCLDQDLAKFPILLNLSMNEVFTSKEQLSCGNWSPTCRPRILAIRSNCSGNCAYLNMSSGVGGLTFLQALQLQAVGFNGTISSYLSNLTGLLYLDLSGNSLIKNVQVLSSFKELWGLNFSGNSPIETLGNLPLPSREAAATLRHLDLSRNNLQLVDVFAFFKTLTAIVHANFSDTIWLYGPIETDLWKIGRASNNPIARPCPGSNCVGSLDLSSTLPKNLAEARAMPQEALIEFMVNNSFRIILRDRALRGEIPTALLAAIPAANETLKNKGGLGLPKPSDWLDLSGNYLTGNDTALPLGVLDKNCLTRPNCEFNCMQPGQRQRGLCVAALPNATFPPDKDVQPIQPIIAAAPDTNKAGNSSILIGLLLGAAGVSLIIITSLAVLVWRAKRKQRLTLSEARSIRLFSNPSSSLPMEFSHEEVLAMTENLSNVRYLSAGGFGRVFRGTINLKGKDRPDQSVDVAVKVLDSESIGLAEEAQLQSYKNEVETIGSARHKNLVRLLGFCAEGRNRILVLEFIPRGDLHSHLHGSRKKDNELTWPVRMGIARGCARALAYLHEECDPRIIHRDIKPNNILLDNNLSPKITDFGLARIIPPEKLELTTKAGGTLGYMDHTLATSGKLTDKSDVYSFGLVLLEVVTGKSPRCLDYETIVSWVWERRENGRWAEIPDAAMEGNYDLAEMQSVINVALTCVLDNPLLRPTMQHVHHVLEGRVQLTERYDASFYNSFLYMTSSEEALESQVIDCGEASSMEVFDNTRSMSHSSDQNSLPSGEGHV